LRVLRTIPLLLALLAIVSGSAYGATAHHKTRKKAVRTRHTVHRRYTAHSKRPAARQRRHYASKRHHSYKRHATATRYRAMQQHPTQERYQQIQQALADHGFYKGDVNGVWGSDSVDALKQFQQSQKLSATGKIDSVSLIALGLGPKRTLTARTNTDPNLPRPQDDRRRTEGSQRP
jgi:Putative peptidoglycan binding domain